MMFPIHRGPMTPEQIARERARMAGLVQSMTIMPTNVGEGLTALGTAINLRQSRKRMDQQAWGQTNARLGAFKAAQAAGQPAVAPFPHAPDAPRQNGFERIAAALAPRQAPTPFSTAPKQQIPGGSQGFGFGKLFGLGAALRPRTGGGLW